MENKPVKRTYAKRTTSYQSKEEGSGFHWAHLLMLLGFLTGVLSFAYIGHLTLVSKYFLLRVAIFTCLIGMCIPIRLYFRWFTFGKVESLLFNLLAVGPLLCAMLLWSNYLFSGPVSVETYRVMQYDLETESMPAESNILYYLEGDALLEYEELRRMELTDKKQLIARAIRYEFAEGLFGYRVVKDQEVVFE